MPISVCVIERNPEARWNIEEQILISDDLELAGSCGTLQEALVIVPALKPQVTLIHLQLGAECGLDCLRELKPRFPEMLFLILAGSEDDENLLEAVCAGASGFLPDRTPPLVLLEAIRELKAGGSPVNARTARRLFQVLQYPVLSEGPGIYRFSGRARPLHRLSKRENEILRWLAEGLLYKEIAAKLFISPETVRKHVYHIYEKLQVSNRVEAINKYFRR